MSSKRLVLGVDGGGTKCLGLVADEFGNVLARKTVGAGNPNVVGIHAAAKNLHSLINQCCDEVRCRPDELRSIVLGLAGAGSERNREQTKDAVHALFTEQGFKDLPLHIETDARIALEGAFGGGPGVVLIAGTGSAIIGKNQRGEVVSVGGWGRLLGDEGSGYFIGREAVRMLTLQADGRGNAGLLRELFEQKYQWKTRDDLLHAVYQEKMELASFAPLVLEAASQNDVVSQRILQNAASLLVDQARVVIMKMGILRKVGLVMMGGMFGKESVYADVVHMKILKSLPQVEVRQPMFIPAHGGILMALENLKRM
jgi:N-acetylglucosamine kinase-like BadF-type ATPase